MTALATLLTLAMTGQLITQSMTPKAGPDRAVRSQSRRAAGPHRLRQGQPLGRPRPREERDQTMSTATTTTADSREPGSHFPAAPYRRLSTPSSHSLDRATRGSGRLGSLHHAKDRFEIMTEGLLTATTTKCPTTLRRPHHQDVPALAGHPPRGLGWFVAPGKQTDAAFESASPAGPASQSPTPRSSAATSTTTPRTPTCAGRIAVSSSRFSPTSASRPIRGHAMHHLRRGRHPCLLDRQHRRTRQVEVLHRLTQTAVRLSTRPGQDVSVLDQRHEVGRSPSPSCRHATRRIARRRPFRPPHRRL